MLLILSSASIDAFLAPRRRVSARATRPRSMRRRAVVYTDVDACATTIHAATVDACATALHAATPADTAVALGGGGAARLDAVTLYATATLDAAAATLDAAALTLDAASVPGASTLALASFQDFRDGVADVVRPVALLAALPAFGIALIPLALVAAVARAAAAPATAVADVLAGVTEEQWTRLIICVALDAVGDLSEALPPSLHGVAEFFLGPLDFFVLQSLFSESLVVPAVGLLEEWLPFAPEFLPTATLAWCLQTLASDSNLAKAVGLGRQENKGA